MSLWTTLFGPPSNNRFAALMMKAIRDTGEQGPVSFDPQSFQLYLPNGSTMALTNAYQEYCRASRRDRQSILRRYASLASTMSKEEQPLSEVQTHLLPKVRDRFYWEAVRFQAHLQQGKSVSLDDLPPHQMLNDQLMLELVIDAPETIRSVTKSDLERWSLSFEQALALAKENLWKKSNQGFKEIAKGIYVSPWKDNHDASRLYLHDLIWQLKVKGDHVAAVPNRDVLIVTGSEDAAGLLEMATLIEEALKLPRPMMASPMRLEGNKWVPLKLPGSHPAYWSLRKLELVTQADLYADQKQMLDTIHQKTGLETFVARYTVIQKRESSKEFSSYCVWSEGVDTMLPHTAEVMFMVGDAPNLKLGARVAWEHMQVVMGALLEPQGMYPERYRARHFPTPQQIIEMKTLQDEIPMAVPSAG